jgi:hypothetical protein
VYTIGIILRDINNTLEKRNSSIKDIKDSGDLVNKGLLYLEDYDLLFSIPREYLIYLPLGKLIA